MLDEIGGVADNTRNQDLPGGEFRVAPDFEFMFVTDVAGLDQVRLGVDTEQDVFAGVAGLPGRAKFGIRSLNLGVARSLLTVE